jgi:tRNA(adenine34) deaminase
METTREGRPADGGEGAEAASAPPARPEDAPFMARALALAERAADLDEVPVGAVVVVDGVVVGEGYNRREQDRDPLAHAEILAIRDAAGRLGRWRLHDATLYVTLEPCPMCAGALVNARVARLVYGAPDPKAGAVRSLYRIVDDPRLNHRAEVTPGVAAEAAAAQLRGFFRRKRGRGKRRPSPED